MILQSGDYLLECLGNDILKQSNTVRFTFKIIESTCPNYPPGLDVQFIQKVKMPEGTWEWNIGASQILGTVRCLMGYAEEAAFRAVAGADDFALSVIRGVPQAALVGRRVRCASSPSGKIDTKRNQPFMNNSWRAA
jgi:hypothetical protein